MKVLISGASIAGPTLAYWLVRNGVEVTVVERAPALREGGHGVDFRGAQMRLLERMDLVDEVRRHETGLGEQVVVDARGERLVTLPSWFASGEVEIARGDLARILYGRTREDAEYRFGDSVAALTQTADGVEVEFERGPARRFDLVVGADGMHSAVRAISFGPETEFATFRGYYDAGFGMTNVLDLDHTGLIYNEPGRVAMVYSARDRDRCTVGLTFASSLLPDDRLDQQQVVDLVVDRYAGAGWEVPRLIEGLRCATDLHFAPLQQIHLDSWSRGRVVLLGDAAWAAGPGGTGTGLAMTGAYVLAAELAAAGDQHATALHRYEAVIRKAAAAGQKQAKGAGPFLAPLTHAKIRRRNRMYRALSSRLLSGVFARLTAGAANAVSIDGYPTPTSGRCG